MRNKGKPLDHSYLFSGMTDAEFAQEGVRLNETEREKADTLPLDDDFLPRDDEEDEIDN